MRVWLVWCRAPWQGDELRGCYSSEEVAQAAVDAGVAGETVPHPQNWSIEEVPVADEVVSDFPFSWHGN